MITATIVGDAEAVALLGRRGENMRVEARKAVDLMALKTLSRVKLKLSDDVLRVRTGRLRRSITQEVRDGPDGVVGTVGTNVEYAATHELGFKGVQQVGQHLRTIKTAFGRSIKGGAVTFTVAAHSRNVDFPARSFLAASLAELEPEFMASLEAVARKAAAP